MSDFNPAQFLILVVDDQRQNLFLLDKILTQAGYQVKLVSSGQQALSVVESHQPDLILLDLMMPEMDGLEVCRRLEATLAILEIPVIFLTASREKTSLLQAFKWGAVDYIIKPFNAPELLARIQTHLSLKHTRDELQKAREAALEVARFKSEFLARMSHEIRAPMNGVLGMTELLGRTDLDGVQQAYVQTLRTSGEHLLSILNEILDISKLEAGEIKIDTHEFDLNKLLEEVVNLFRVPAEQKKLHLSYCLQPHVPQYLLGDSFRIRQVLINFVNNAIKFTQAGSVRLTVDIVGDKGKKLILRFAVIDTGVGIAPDTQKRLFQAFSQGDVATAREYGGTGLGLAICKQLVELMQGDIGVESEMGQGSTFWVTLPLVVVQWSSHSRQPDATPSHSPQGMTHLPRILLVEDTRINQKVVQHQLSLLGYQADVAQNGQEAVARLTEQVYDLVLMDCQMPILDGLQATQVLREREKGGQRLVIVGLTGQVSERDRAQGLAAGMDDYLTKPLTLESLQETLDKWLGRQQEAGGGRQKQ